MIFICLAFFVVTVFMTVFLTTLALIPSLCYTFYQVTIFLLDIAAGAAVFYWNIMMFVFDIAKELIRIVKPVFTHVMPVIYFCARDLYVTARGLVLEVLRSLRHGEEGLALVWGAIVTCIYFYWNQILEAYRERPDRQDQMRDATEEEENNQRPHRLYPDLNDIDNYINNNEVDVNDNHNEQINRDNEDIAVRQRRNNINQRTSHCQLHDAQTGTENRYCVVCFERERDTAIFPCGHTHTCMQCTLAIKRGNSLCPICQQNIREHRRVFV